MFQVGKAALGAGFEWTADDVRILLLEGEGGTEPDRTAETIDALTGDELDTDNYARQPVTGRAIERGDADDLARWLADDLTFADLGPFTDGPNVAGAVLFVHLTDDTDSWPLLWLADVTGETNGTDFTVAFDPTGVVRLRDPE